MRDRVKFRVGRIVYLAFSRDETMMGFAFPKEERDALVASRAREVPPAEARGPALPLGRRPPRPAIDEDELREIVEDAWRMCVPKRVAAPSTSDPDIPHIGQ